MKNPPAKPWPLFVLLSLSLALSACSKKEAAPKAPPPAQQSISVDAQSAEPPPPPPTAPAPAPVAGSDSQAPAPPDAAAPDGPEATTTAIAAYNQELSRWIGMHEEAPVDLNALKKVKGLPPLPVAPPGRQIIYVVTPKAPISSHLELK